MILGLSRFSSYFGIEFMFQWPQRHLKYAALALIKPMRFSCFAVSFVNHSFVQEARQAPMPDIRSGQLFCKVFAFTLSQEPSRTQP
jgi:hypothetical protein